jgi:RHS repeat-associated protein
MENRKSALEDRHSTSEAVRLERLPSLVRRGLRGGVSRLAFFLVTVALAVSSASAQVITGLPPYGSFSGGPDVVNNASLNAHLSVPVVGEAGRGLPFSNTLTYDSSIWYPTGTSGSQYWAQLPNWGWRGIVDGSTGYVYESVTTDYCTAGGVQYNYPAWTFGPYVDTNGTLHPVFVTTYQGNTNCGIFPQPHGVSNATDGSGLTLVLNNYTYPTIYSRSGGSTVPLTYNSGAFAVLGTLTVTDANGNYLTPSLSNGTATIVDTLGNTALTVTGSGTPSSPTKFTYTAATGNQAHVTMNYAAYTVQTNFGCSGITEFGATPENLVSSVVYPDGTSYSFTYEVTPGDNHNPHYVTGRPASITLPTGGTISYSYSGGSNGITCADGSAATLERATPDGTCTYAHSENGTAWTTTLTDPQSDVTTFNFQGIYETERQVAGLETVYTCYNGSSFPCNGTSVSLPISQRTVTASLGGLESQVNTNYNAYGLPTEVDGYNYGNGAVGSLVRKTTTTYWTPAKSYIKNRLSTVSVYNGSGTLLNQTSYSYDAFSLVSTSGTPQFSNPTGARGNPTSITLSGSGFGNLSMSINYFDTGQTYQVTGFDGAVTTYNSGTGACGNSFDTTVSLPMSLSESFAWNCNAAVESSATDVNNNTTSYSYDNMDRLIQTSFPDGGVSNTQYASATVTDVCTLISGSLTGCTPGSGSVVRHDETVLDGLGRTLHQDLVSDPAGETYVDTTYDSLGRAYTKSNPYRSTSDPTYGMDTYSYDALNRTTRITHSDSSYSQVAYGTGTQSCAASTYGYGYPTLNTEESGNQRRTFTDALGRTVEVDEPDPSNGNSLTLNTCYGYDAQGDLTSVVQGSETRSYSYSGLSQLTQETTPEGGITYYYYTTSGGALCANNQKLVCRKTDARGITTTYAYDALDRLTGKSYSNGDPSVTYYYDQTSYNGLTITNGKGQRTGMSDGSGQTAWSFDKMARIVAEKRTIGTVTKTMSYGYNLDGSLASITYPSGRVVSYTYGGDARPVSAVDSANSINYATSATYAPQGGLVGMLNGEVSGGFSGIITSSTYNNRLFPTVLSATSSNGTALSLSYAYFPNGDVNVETNGRDNGRNVTYTYDALNRVSTATSQATSGSDCWGQSFAYDRYANLTTTNVTKCTATALSLSFNTHNQITSSGFNYDAAGDLTADGSYTYSWNAEQHLTSAGNVTYTYDGDLKRVKKSSGTLYWYCAVCGQVLAESDLSGNLTREYTYFGIQRIARRDVSSGNIYYIFSDRLGSYRTLTDSTGHVQGESDYYPFGGERVISSTVTDSFRFTGMEWDSEDGLNHTLYRKYTPGQGRWETPDPKRGDITNPQSLNRYAYVLNNPTTLTDPPGLLFVNGGCVASFTGDEGSVVGSCSGGWLNLGPVGLGDGGGGGGGQDKPTPQTVKVKGSLTSTLEPQLAAAIKNLSPSCQKFFNTLPGGMAALSGCASNLQFFNASSAAGDGSLLASSVLTGAPNESLYTWLTGQAANAAVLSNSYGISNGVVIGGYFNDLGSQQGAVLIHEASHYAYQLNDGQLYSSVQNFNPGFDPAQYGYPSAKTPDQKYTAFIAAGCPQ